ncbi:MAG: NAD(P)-binding domain-containing protein [Vicinamibacterales bacterium]
MSSVGFIGGGRVTRILAAGWRRADALPAQVMVHDPDPHAIEALRAEVPNIEAVATTVVAAADCVFLALHPPALPHALAEIKPLLRRDAILVSLAPKVPIAVLEQLAGTRRVARMIPSAPSTIGQGFNPVAFGAGVDERGRTVLTGLFAAWGRAPEVPEQTLEAYAILTGMGPTYFWFQWQALREVGTQLGLAAPETDAALRAMVEGALSTLLDAGMSPAAVMDLIPVKPLAQLESDVAGAYHTLLPALYSKIRPVEATVG